MGSILGALRSLGYLFGGFLGLHFGVSMGALGSILGALGISWEVWGVPGGSLGRPRGPELNFATFFPPILESF